MKNFISIKLNKEFKRAYFQGKYKPHPALVTYLYKNRLGYNRIGITTSKKIGNAVQRNRARRVIRAAYAQVKNEFQFSCGYDIVFVARSQTAAVKSTELEKIMLRHFLFLVQECEKRKSNTNSYQKRKPKKEESKG